jgi:hypothetical protein
MAVNAWSCDRRPCGMKAVGVAGAAGLRAVGWYFSPGIPPVILCPLHHPKGRAAAKNQADDLQGELEEVMHAAKGWGEGGAPWL